MVCSGHKRTSKEQQALKTTAKEQQPHRATRQQKNSARGLSKGKLSRVHTDWLGGRGCHDTIGRLLPSSRRQAFHLVQGAITCNACWGLTKESCLRDTGNLHREHTRPRGRLVDSCLGVDHRSRLSLVSPSIEVSEPRSKERADIEVERGTKRGAE